METCFLIHKLSQKRLSNATILIPNASIYCGVQARTSFFFCPRDWEVIISDTFKGAFKHRDIVWKPPFTSELKLQDWAMLVIDGTFRGLQPTVQVP